MNSKYTRAYILVGMILMVCAVHGSDESGWTPWQSPDLHGDVVVGQTQLKLETERKRLEAEEKQEFAERGLMHVEENSERNRLRQVDQLKQQTLLQAQKKALQAKERARKQKKKDRIQVAKLEQEINETNKKVAALREEALLEEFMDNDEVITKKFVTEKRKKLLNDSFADEQELECIMIDRRLQEKSILPADIQRIVGGYEIAFGLEVELKSRTLPSGIFYIDNSFWPIFFYDCFEIIDSNAAEILHHLPSEVLQKNINELLDDRNYNITTNFYKTILYYSTEVIHDTRNRLAIICEDEKKIIENLIRDKSPMAQLAMANLKKFKEMLKFIDDGKKI